MTLSKSDFLLYLKHPAWLWLKKHNPKKLPPIDDSLQQRFDEGHTFEAYAEALFPGGTTLGFNDFDEYQTLPARTQTAITRGDQTLFQARLEADELTCISDILTRNHTGYDLYEIKSSTKVKPEHLVDLAFQYLVLTRSGLKIDRIFVIHVNNQYERAGEIDSNKITITTNVTQDVLDHLKQVESDIEQALSVMHSTTMPDPSPRFVRMSAMGEWLPIYKNLYPDLPVDSIYRLASPSAKLLGELEDQGIATIKQIPAAVKLSTKQSWQREAAISGQPIVHQERIKHFLDSLTYPLYFLDYETLGSVIPRFDGMRPYQQLPFQYSLHVITSPGATLMHVEFLHTENSNPSPALIAQLQENIGPTGTILTWNQGFEKGCHDTMATMFPEHATFLHGLNDRVRDLMEPFAKGWYFDARFGGSASIKKVLPVLVPTLSYDELSVNNGVMAQQLWMGTILDEVLESETHTIMCDLLRYCELDTLAMVEIHNYLIKVVA